MGNNELSFQQNSAGNEWVPPKQIPNQEKSRVLRGSVDQTNRNKLSLETWTLRGGLMRRKVGKTKQPAKSSIKKGLEGRNEEENGRNEGLKGFSQPKQAQYYLSLG